MYLLINFLDVLPESAGWRYFYGTLTIILCLIISLIGASEFLNSRILVKKF